MPFLRHLIWISACDQFIITAKHVPGSKNQIADSLSRFYFQKFTMLAPEVDPVPAPVPHYSQLNLPINHLLKSLLDTSINTILQAVSPRILQTYYRAWKSFKTFHLFPDFSFVSFTSFISHHNIVKVLQARSIKGYLRGIQFFHKLAYSKPASAINNSHTSLLIKGIQRTHLTCPDTRQPITIDILTKWISTLRLGYHSINTALTLEAMFIQLQSSSHRILVPKTS